MDRRVLTVVTSIALLVSATGCGESTQGASATSLVTILPPEQTTTTTEPAVSGTIRSTLPPTPSGEVFVYAADGGCTPGTNQLPDGEYHGSVVINSDRTITFNLKCLFLAADLPDNFDELFADRFPGQTFPATGADLIDPAAIDRAVRFNWNSEFIIDDGLYVGDEAPVYYDSRGSTPFDATILIEDGRATTVVEITGGEVNPG